MAQVLRQMQPVQHPDLIVGTSTFDDAGVFRLDDETALVQTTDFFPPLVDDPYEFGRIAAANALSDVYAMGGTPLTCLNLVGFPDQELPAEVLGEILRGGAERAAAAGAVIVGGHSVRDAEVKYGMAVTGTVHPRRVWTNAGAVAGDVLILTKPIGSGILTSAAKSGRLPVEELAETIETMTGLNKPGRDAGVALCRATGEPGPIHACTDITGFGLLGHAFELAEGAGLTLEIEAEGVPLLVRAREMAEAGVLTRAHKSTLAYLGDALLVGDGVDPTLVRILADAQTSGGLLFAVAGDQADALLALLGEHRAQCAVRIGRVRPREAAAIRLV